MTNFYTDDQRMIRVTAREFAQQELAANAARFDQDGWRSKRRLPVFA